MTDYEQETIDMILSRNSRLNEYNVDSIYDMYREWSSTMFSAGWMFASERRVDLFVKWATTAPCDNYVKSTGNTND
jgi:hypothetical protein